MSARITAPRRRNNAISISPDGDHASQFHHVYHSSTPGRVTPPSAPATPRSTLGSPLSTHATVRRSGTGDLAAGPRRRVSLSDVEVLPWFCCMTPALSLFGLYTTILVSALFCTWMFDLVTAVLTFIVMLWISNLAIASMVGAYNLRQGSMVDWQDLLEQLQNEDPTANDVLHIVLLPNYKENEKMLKETLENLGRSPMARSRTRIILAMEAREGPAGREKAERLIAATQHLFADIFATYHPENLPGEVVGKSSNTQWAYREALRQYGPILLGCDLSRVFVTVGDADTLWHPQYLSALTYLALTMPPEDRAWTIWQPPILLMRNLFTVPAMTRASSHATLIFELAGLANQYFFPAFAYSAYSMTLALASHPEVDGWDVDVIAEDHHMFCKCYFAALWELAHAAITPAKPPSDKDPGIKVEMDRVLPQLEVQPIYLPAVSYLVESSDGYWSSCYARFQQARRHSQGIVELGYVLLQYARLTRFTGFFKLPSRTHIGILTIAVKMHTLHIITTSQVVALITSAIFRIAPQVIRWLFAGGLGLLLSQASVSGVPLLTFLQSQLSDGWSHLSVVQQALTAAVSNISFVVLLYSISAWFVVSDLVEGRYYKHLGIFLPRTEMTPVAEGDESSGGGACNEDEGGSADSAGGTGSPLDDGTPSFVVGTQTVWQRIVLFLHIFSDTSMIGYPSLVTFAVIPTALAGWSLLRRGTQFDYIVAVKPE
mmetsp:Transcript_38216/g.110263  ORF Transcript_38216/g.110263 Transcript_38216/m.110263 type:complete len:717 (-) Transcript_38216:237-2387(-)